MLVRISKCFSIRPTSLHRKALVGAPIHSSVTVLGRKSGTDAFDQAPRGFSKKQKETS